MLASAEGVEQMTLAVVGSWSAASPAPSTFCLLLCPWTKPSFSALAAGLLATFLTADAKTGTRWVCLFILNPSDRMSLFRWIASIGIRMMGFSILTCECNQKLMQGTAEAFGMTVRRCCMSLCICAPNADTVSGFLTADLMVSHDTQPSGQVCASWAHARALCKMR